MKYYILKYIEGSDCGSEASSLSIRAQTPTQRATDEQKQLKSSKCVSGSMSIDTKQLYDPDSLWRRKKRR